MHTGTKTRDTVATAATQLVSGVCAGTTIMTLDGEIPVEHLTAGTRVITRDSGMAVLRGVTSRTLRIAPIRIKAGSLGHTRPDRDMMVAPGTQIHIRDWRAEALFGSPTAMVEAQRLVDGEFLAVQDEAEMTVYTLTFDRQHILYADGIEMASAAV
ncbi:Hint domain-containing protein [Loktanella sp. DJP18]|uniref:Hint domain-containing protein n=1 Tax=Loktanella sp. DJP18 TaxID=3409788 RepID=UPI003BB7829A